MKTVALGDLVSIQTGKLDANASSPDGAYPFFTCAREPLKIADWKYDLDAILIAGNGDLNIKHYKGKFDAYQRTYILSAKDRNVDTRYLYHFLDTYLDRLREQSVGGIIKYIKLGMLTDAPIPLPPLDEQKRIAAILDQADDLRRQRKQALALFKQLGQAIFYEMFGDPTLTTAQNLRPLGECMRLINGRAYRKEEERQSGTPVLRIQNLNGGKRWFYSDLTLPNDKYCVDGDLLFAWSATFGPYIWRGPRVIYHYHIWKIEPIEGICDKLYAYQLLSLLSDSVKAGGRGISMTHATKSGMEERLIPVPSLEKQLKFKDCLLAAQSSLRCHQDYVFKSEELFAVLQHRAFQGEL